MGEVFGLLCGLMALMCGLAALVFWAWMLIDCLTNEPSDGNDKLIWALVIVLTNTIGAFIYYFVRRPERIAKYGQ